MTTPPKAKIVTHVDCAAIRRSQDEPPASGLGDAPNVSLAHHFSPTSPSEAPKHTISRSGVHRPRSTDHCDRVHECSRQAGEPPKMDTSPRLRAGLKPLDAVQTVVKRGYRLVYEPDGAGALVQL